MQNIETLATYNASKDEIDDAAIYVKGNVIAWVGKTADLPQEYSTADEIISMKDRVVIPGMVTDLFLPSSLADVGVQAIP